MDDLDARLRGLRAPTPHRDDKLSVRAEQHLNSLLLEAGPAPAPSSRRTPWRSMVAGMVAASLVLMLAIVLVTQGGTRAVALTPKPLEFVSMKDTSAQIMEQAAEKLGQAGAHAFPQRRADYTGWFVKIDEDAPPKESVAISPEVVHLEWNEDLSARQVVTAGKPYWADTADREPIGDAAPAQGTVLSDTSFGPGEFGVPAVAAPGSTEDDMRALLESLGMPADAGAGDMIESIGAAMTLWTLTDAQHAALLHLLLEDDDIEVLGHAADRSGQNVIGLEAPSKQFPGTSRIMLLSEATGRIVGIEAARTTPTTQLPAGSVIAYRLWKDQP